jgi:hypothetical protein
LTGEALFLVTHHRGDVMEEQTESGIREVTPQAWASRFRQRYENRLIALAARGANQVGEPCAEPAAEPIQAGDRRETECLSELVEPEIAGGTQPDPTPRIERFTSLFSQAYVAARHPQVHGRAREALCDRRSVA